MAKEIDFHVKIVTTCADSAQHRTRHAIVFFTEKAPKRNRFVSTDARGPARLVAFILVLCSFAAHSVLGQTPSEVVRLSKLAASAVLGTWHYDIVSKKTAKLQCRFTFAYDAGGLGNLTISQQSPKRTSIMPFSWYSKKGSVIISFSKKQTAVGAFFDKDKLFGQLSPDAKILTVAWPGDETEPMVLHR